MRQTLQVCNLMMEDALGRFDIITKAIQTRIEKQTTGGNFSRLKRNMKEALCDIGQGAMEKVYGYCGPDDIVEETAKNVRTTISAWLSLLERWEDTPESTKQFGDMLTLMGFTFNQLFQNIIKDEAYYGRKETTGKMLRVPSVELLACAGYLRDFVGKDFKEWANFPDREIRMIEFSKDFMSFPLYRECDYNEDFQGKVKHYAVINRPEAETMLSRSEKRIFGGLAVGTRISNSAFHICATDIPYNYRIEGDTEIETARNIIDRAYEFNIVTRMHKYVAPGGGVLFPLILSRITKSVVQRIIRLFDDIVILKGSDLFLDKYSVLCFGVVKKNQDKEKAKVEEEQVKYTEKEEALYWKLRSLFLHDIDEEFWANERVECPVKTWPMAMPVQEFIGTVIDIVELEEFASHSPAFQALREKQEVHVSAEELRHPLLPFNTGQLGLILASGQLDGVVEEENGGCHAVKGRVIKTVDRTRTIEKGDSGDEVNIVETTGNRVELNVLLPDGTFKRLA